MRGAIAYHLKRSRPSLAEAFRVTTRIHSSADKVFCAPLKRPAETRASEENSQQCPLRLLLKTFWRAAKTRPDTALR